MAFDRDHWADAVLTWIKVLSTATTMGSMGMGCCEEGVRDAKLSPMPAPIRILLTTE